MIMEKMSLFDQRKTYKIMVVDNAERMRKDAVSCLSDVNCEVDEAKTGEEALALML